MVPSSSSHICFLCTSSVLEPVGAELKELYMEEDESNIGKTLTIESSLVAESTPSSFPYHTQANPLERVELGGDDDDEDEEELPWSCPGSIFA